MRKRVFIWIIIIYVYKLLYIYCKTHTHTQSIETEELSCQVSLHSMRNKEYEKIKIFFFNFLKKNKGIK